ARPAAIALTGAANARIAELMSKAPEGAIGVKLSTPRRGCSGLAYSVDYVTEEQPFDEKIETPAVPSMSTARQCSTWSGRSWTGARMISPPASYSTTRTPRAPAAAAKASRFERREDGRGERPNVRRPGARRDRWKNLHRLRFQVGDPDLSRRGASVLRPLQLRGRC